MTRIYIAIVVLLSMGAGIWYHIQVARENAVLKISISSAEQRIKTLEEDQKIKEGINRIAIQKQKEAEREKDKLQRTLAKLPRTQAQRDCDSMPTPAGYAQRMLDYARLQGPISPAGSELDNADGDRAKH